jgi:putative membrane protein insertion efficiency factor
MSRALVMLLRGGLRAYQLVLSPVLGPACRFSPSCSEYAREALQLHGVRRGSWLAVARLARCHPFAAGGFDPVPLPGARAFEAARGSGARSE